MKAHSTKLIGMAAALLASLAAGCGEVSRTGRAPVTLVIDSLVAENGNTLLSDVMTDEGGTLNDLATVTMRILLKDPGIPGITATPSPLNAVTITRYRVEYARTDGRNQPGVDVPYGFDSAMTVTVNQEGRTEATFELVRNTAKWEAPLMGLRQNATIISTIATVTFYGHDQVGNEITGQGSMGVFFGQFVDDDQ